jgi:hypothetical protein
MPLAGGFRRLIEAGVIEPASGSSGYRLRKRCYDRDREGQRIAGAFSDTYAANQRLNRDRHHLRHMHVINT